MSKVFEQMTCSLAANMQEVKIFSERILKNGSVLSSYCSLCCVLRTISHASYWMQSWYIAQLTHLYNIYNILQSDFSSSESARQNGCTPTARCACSPFQKWWSLEPPGKWGEFVPSSELIKFSYFSIKNLNLSFRCKLKSGELILQRLRLFFLNSSCSRWSSLVVFV